MQYNIFDNLPINKSIAIVITSLKEFSDSFFISNRACLAQRGKKIHDAVECDKPTGSQLDNDVNEPGALFLQGDHGTVSFRNIRIKELGK